MKNRIFLTVFFFIYYLIFFFVFILVEDLEIKFINIKPIGECYINVNKLFRTDFYSVN